MAPPRVLFVDHAGVLGGAELSLLDVAAALGARARVVLLADGPFRDLLERRGVPVAVEPMGALAGVRKATRLPAPGALLDAVRVLRRLAARAGDVDVLCANSQKAFVVAALAAWRAGRPLAWMLRDILAPPHFSGPNVRAAVLLANTRSARVIANSRATADAFIAAGGRAALVRVVHNGIDAAPFDAVSDDAALAQRRALGVPDGAFTVAMLGRFHPWKGQQVLLDALARLPGVHAIVAGAPLFGEDAFARELESQAVRLGVRDRVHFTGFRDDAPVLLRAADAVVHASVYPEPFGRVIVEGMLARRPVIASNAGGVPEIVEDGVTGLLVPPGDVAALAAAIASLRDDRPRAAAIAERGAAWARERFTVAAMVRGIEEALAT
ncbi:MAG: glycosyltransferase [Gemmatimonadetes bacterium]|nr:glycosyltransferase [Gemmatimonadota bacterium]